MEEKILNGSEKILQSIIQAFSGLEGQSAGVSEEILTFPWAEAEFAEINSSNLNALKFSDLEYRWAFDKVICIILRCGSKILETYFCHTFMYQVFNENFINRMSGLTEAQGCALFGGVEYIYEDLLGLKSDSFWVSEKSSIRKALVR